MTEHIHRTTLPLDYAPDPDPPFEPMHPIKKGAIAAVSCAMVVWLFYAGPLVVVGLAIATGLWLIAGIFNEEK